MHVLTGSHILLHTSMFDLVHAASPTESCPEVSSVGLWVDAFNFVVITLQIMIFSSRYSDFIKDDLIKREANAARLVADQYRHGVCACR